jgi:hypothetical protein
MGIQESISRTKNWVEKIVIGLDLCPFARFPYNKDLIRYVSTDLTTEGELLQLLYDELVVIDEAPETSIETTLVILTKGWPDFMEYLDLVDLAEEILERLELVGVIQIASFHPAYQFAHLDDSDVRNYTNRSPYPMIHLIREDSVTKAVDSHPDIESVPVKNEETMIKMGLPYFKDFEEKNK